MQPADDLKGASLTQLQKYIKGTLSARGFDDETLAQKFMLLIEEVGELAQAARRHAKIKVDKDKELGDINDEMGDVLILLLDIANKLHVDVEEAFIQKEIKNSQRNWH